MNDEYLIGWTIVEVQRRKAESGDEYIRYVLENDKGSRSYVEHLLWFTATDHKMAIAEEALEELEKGPYGGPTAYTAGQALQEDEGVFQLMENMHELLEGRVRLIHASALSIPLPDNSIHCCVTSPPYWGLRDYESAEDQIGLEKTPEEYVEKMVRVFSEVKRVLRDDGTLWLNLGDSYAHPNTGGNGATGGRDKSTLASKMPPIGTTPVKKNMPPNLKQKNLIGIPWLVAFALQRDGWYLRQDIIWSKPNPMPESVKDRCTRSHEYIFLLSKSPKYYYDGQAIREPTVSTTVKKFTDGGRDKQRGHERRHAGFNGRYAETLKEEGVPTLKNKRDVWTVTPSSYKEAHFATYPPKLIEPCILAGCPENGIVLDPFGGSGTTARVAIDNRRTAVLLDVNYHDREGSYLDLAKKRILAPAKEIREKKDRRPKFDYSLFKDVA